MSEKAKKTKYHRVTVRWWFLFSGAVMLVATAALFYLLGQEHFSIKSWAAFKESITGADSAIKLLALGIYLALSCTFIPLNTGWLISASAMQDTAVASTMWATILLVSVVGAAASTLANMNDYHIFILMMRNHHVAKVENTRLLQWAGRWFKKSPFGLTFLFNILPIPVDFIRPLAAVYRYPRWPFAVANFSGRFLRYMIIAAITYQLGKQGWIAPVILLGFAILCACPRLFMKKKPQVELEAADE